MRYVLVALGAVVLTGLLTVYQMPTLLDELLGRTETAAGVSALPDVSSPPPAFAIAEAERAASEKELADIISDSELSDDTRIDAIEDVGTSVELDFRTTEALVEALRDPSSDVYEAAADALWDMDDLWLTSILRSMFDEYVGIDPDRAEIIKEAHNSSGPEEPIEESGEGDAEADWDQLACMRWCTVKEIKGNGVVHQVRASVNSSECQTFCRSYDWGAPGYDWGELDSELSLFDS